MGNRIFEVIEADNITKQKSFLVHIDEAVQASAEELSDELKTAIALLINNKADVLRENNNIVFILGCDQAGIRYRLGTHDSGEMTFPLTTVRHGPVRIARVSASRLTSSDTHEKAPRKSYIRDTNTSSDVDSFTFTDITTAQKPEKIIAPSLRLAEPRTLNGANIQGEANKESYAELLRRYDLTDEPEFRQYLQNTRAQNDIEEENAAQLVKLTNLEKMAARLAKDHPLQNECNRVEALIDNITDEKLQPYKETLTATLASTRKSLAEAFQGRATIRRAQMSIEAHKLKTHNPLSQLKNLIIESSALDHVCGNSIAVLEHYRKSLTQCLLDAMIDCANAAYEEMGLANEQDWKVAHQLLAHRINVIFGKFATLTPTLTIKLDENLPFEKLVSIAKNILEETGSTMRSRNQAGPYRTTKRHLENFAKKQGNHHFEFNTPMSGIDSLNITDQLLSFIRESYAHQSQARDLVTQFQSTKRSAEALESHLEKAINRDDLTSVEKNLLQLTKDASQETCHAELKAINFNADLAAFKTEIQRTQDVTQYDRSNLELPHNIDPDAIPFKEKIEKTLELINQIQANLKDRAKEILLRLNYELDNINSNFELDHNKMLDLKQAVLDNFKTALKKAEEKFLEEALQYSEALRETLLKFAPPESTDSEEISIELSSSVNSQTTRDSSKSHDSKDSGSLKSPVDSNEEDEPIQVEPTKPITAMRAVPHAIVSNGDLNPAKLLAQEIVSPCMRMSTLFKRIPGFTWKRSAICVAAGITLGAATGVALFFLCPALILPFVVAIGVAAAALVIAGSIGGIAIHHKITTDNKARRAISLFIAENQGEQKLAPSFSPKKSS